MLYTVRFRLMPKPAEEALIEASSDDTARRVGIAYCEKLVSDSQAIGQTCKFIGVRPAIVADESILAPPPTAAAEPVPVPPPKQSIADRLKEAIAR